jgi:hypothetical protein
MNKANVSSQTNILNYDLISKMIPKDSSLILNLRLRLNDSIPIIASIKKPLIHVRASLGQVIQIILVIHHPRWALLIVPHERVVDTGLRHLRLCICQDHHMRHMSFLLGNHLHGVFLLNDLLRCGSSRWHKSRGWRHINRGATSPPPLPSSSSASSPMRPSPISLAIFIMSSP